MNEEVRLHLERADDCIKDAELLLSAKGEISKLAPDFLKIILYFPASRFVCNRKIHFYDTTLLSDLPD